MTSRATKRSPADEREAAARAVATERVDGYLPIEDYAAIGDGRTLALVGSDGSIDWMCLPELDAPSVFASLLDPERGGRFVVIPAVPFRVRRRYVEGTNVLETTFETESGTVRVTDALTLDSSLQAPWRELVRLIEGVSGNVPMRISCRPAFGFGQQPAVWQTRDAGFLARDGELQIGLSCWDLGDLRIDGPAVAGDAVVHEGSRGMLVLCAAHDRSLPMPSRGSVERRLAATHEVWRSWAARHTYSGPWREAVDRSLLALRLLADGRTGAIAAAGTSSLPEALGGQRNYDYRYAWVRDLSFTVDAMLRIGMEELAHRSISWIVQAVERTAPRVDPVYTLTGEVLRDQQPLDLAGYRKTTPVNLGNKAGSQLQLGGAGDLAETIWQSACRGAILSPKLAERLADIADQLCHIWRRPDAGLWELGDYAQYTTSKLSCWVTFERILELVRREQVPARHVSRWEQEREAVRQYIETELWSERRQSYRFKAGSDELDCGVLLAARRGYVPRGSERLSSTIDAIIAELDAGDGLLYRYSGMQQQENAFIACSFWMIEALAYVGGGRCSDEAGRRSGQRPRPVLGGDGAGDSRHARKLPAGSEPPRPDQRGADARGATAGMTSLPETDSGGSPRRIH
jgi:GH15 family glucan-1,4-alpha-glucosidase